MDYYLYIYATGTRVFHMNALEKTLPALQQGDVVRMERLGGVVRVYINGALAHEYSTPSTTAYFIDVALYTGASLGYFKSSFGVPWPGNPFPVVWTNLTRMISRGDSLEKTLEGWNGNASSLNRLAPWEDGWLEFEAEANDKALMMGLAGYDLSGNYTYIDYALYLRDDGQLGIYEKESWSGLTWTYQAGDVFRVERLGTDIRYLKNGQVLYVSPYPSTGPLLADVSFYSLGAKVSNINASFYLSHPPAQDLRVERTFDYDHAGRLVNTWHAMDEPVRWKDEVNLGQSVSGPYKTSTSGTWDSGAASTQLLPASQSGGMRFRANGTSTRRLLGLSAGNADTNWNTIQYGFYFNLGYVEIREQGSPNQLQGARRSYKDGDEFRIERRDGTLQYWHENDLLRSVPVEDVDLLVDVSIHTPGHHLETVYMTSSPILLSRHEYNELGELIEKNLHAEDGTTFHQSVDYRYNIRGWLTSINNAQLDGSQSNNLDTNQPTDYWGMELGYNAVLPGITKAPAFNGNISAVQWSDALGTHQRAYAYTYDPMNRLREADHFLSGVNTAAFDVMNLSYDLNGNIETLDRNNAQGGSMDQLIYNYGAGANRGNKLLFVGDASGDPGGFKNGNIVGHDYRYDDNGNMTEDLNKAIIRITYNHLNLPETVEKADGQRIRYVYDAQGTKLSQHVEAGEVLYESDFSAGEDGWILSRVALYPNQDNVAGQDDVLKITAHANDINHSIRKLLPINLESTRVEMDVYIPSANTHVDGVRVQLGASVKDFTVTPDQWQTLTWDAYSTSTVIYLYQTAGGNPNFHGSGSPDDDILYIKNVKLTVFEGTTMDYVGEFIYEEDELHLVQHEEGRIVPDAVTGEWAYEYFLKDHLGNTRVVFTTKPKTIRFKATMESEAAGEEEALFSNLPETREKFTAASHSPDKVAKLDAQNPVGPAISLQVGAGDTVRIAGYAFFEGGTGYSSPGNLPAFVAAVAGAFGGINGSGVPAEQATFNLFDNAYGIIGLQGTGADTIPAAYLNYIYFDQNMTYKRSGFKQVSSSANFSKEYVTFPDDIVIEEPGFIYCFVSMESTTGRVFWDDFEVTVVEHPVVQRNDYYPFGLSFNTFQRATARENRYKYNGNEEQQDWDIYDFKARFYDTNLGRFTSVDPLADLQLNQSPYQYAWNSPVVLNDPTGMIPCASCPGIADIIYMSPGSDLAASEYKATGGLQGSITVENAGVEISRSTYWGADGNYHADIDYGDLTFTASQYSNYSAGGFDSMIDLINVGQQNSGTQQTGGSLEVSLGLLSVGSYAYGINNNIRAISIAEKNLEMLNQLKNSARLNMRRPTATDRNLVKQITQNNKMLQGMKLGAKRMVGVGTVIGLVDLANANPEDRANKAAWLAADTTMGVIGLTGWGAPIAGMYFAGRFAYGLYEMATADGN